MTSKSGKQRNRDYEAKRKADGLVKVTLWVPRIAAADFRRMAEVSAQSKGALVPFMVREVSTGKLRRGV